MSKPSKREFADAIISSSPNRVQHLIDQGYDVNLPLFDDAIDAYDPNVEDFEPGSEEIIALSSGENACTMAYPLHVAVVTLYHEAMKKCGSNEYGVRQLIRIIKILLANGFWGYGCGDVLILNASGYDWVAFRRDYPENTALHLAIFLKKYERFGSNKAMDEAIELLQNASKKQAKPILKTTPVLTSVASCYKGLLFSEDFSDISFQCSDGVSVPAHKNILAASSPYFKVAFQGDWAENNSDGIWQTTHDSNLIKSVLTLIYTGSVEECKKLMSDRGADPLDLLNLACEYDIKTLIHISVDNCKKRLKVSNIRGMLQSAHVHSCEKLKKACFEFIKKNSSKVLMHPDMMSLAAEDSVLWTELGSFLNGTSETPSKRQRLHV
mmetsp:Transcript_13066/g.24005  ORF Transcript_13066/g.24005 Transcript_13066/m.24005 type:complete len:381 (+) Transcript_13066:164-1306(+)